MSVVHRLQQAIASFPAQSRTLGAGRTVLALAQASILAFTPSSHLFVPVGGGDVDLHCTTFPQRVSAYCLVDPSHLQPVSWGLLAVLLVVASGILPRYTAIAHFWVALSLHSSLSLPDGGEAVAQVVTFFLVLACLDDRRRWHWQRADASPGTSAWRGAAWAGTWGLRLQVAYVYLNSAVAKVPVAPWQEGTATYYVARMENFGVSGPLADLVLWSTREPLVALATSWGAIVTETAIAVLLLLRGRWPAYAVALSAALHLAIIAELGIVSFGLVMIGSVACAGSRGVDRYLAQRGAARPAGRPGPSGRGGRAPSVVDVAADEPARPTSSA